MLFTVEFGNYKKVWTRKVHAISTLNAIKLIEQTIQLREDEFIQFVFNENNKITYHYLDNI